MTERVIGAAAARTASSAPTIRRQPDRWARARASRRSRWPRPRSDTRASYTAASMPAIASAVAATGPAIPLPITSAVCAAWHASSLLGCVLCLRSASSVNSAGMSPLSCQLRHASRCGKVPADSSSSSDRVSWPRPASSRSGTRLRSETAAGTSEASSQLGRQRVDRLGQPRQPACAVGR